MPNIEISVPGFKLHSTDSEFELETDDIGFFSKELAPKPDKNFIGGIKHNRYRFHIAFRDEGIIWAHVKDQVTGQEMSNFLLPIDVESIGRRVLRSIKIVNHHSLPEEYASRTVKVLDPADMVGLMGQENITIQKCEEIYSRTSEVPLGKIHTVSRYAFGFDEDLWVISHPQGVIIIDSRKVIRIVREYFEALWIYLGRSLVSERVLIAG